MYCSTLEYCSIAGLARVCDYVIVIIIAHLTKLKYEDDMHTNKIKQSFKKEVCLEVFFIMKKKPLLIKYDLKCQIAIKA